MSKKSEKLDTEPCAALLYDPTIVSWETVRHDILNIEHATFPSKPFDEKDLEAFFKNRSSVIVFLKAGTAIVGYTLGHPDQEHYKSLYIFTTGIEERFQGKGHVAELMRTLEQEAKKRGFTHITRDARIDNGYADAISRHYGSRIDSLQTSEHDSPWGRQRFFKIAL